MELEKVNDHVKDIFGMPADDGRTVYDFILKNNIKQILELGFAHGRSTCYMAAALEEAGSGRIITMDFENAKERKPNITSLLAETGLKRYVTPVFSKTSFTWDLMKMIEKQTRGDRCVPTFDFCYADAGHSWDVTGFGFFLVEKLLKPGGWILFDDLNWTYARSRTLKDTEYVRSMPQEQKTTPQIERVFSLLVRQHPDFCDFKIDGNWGWARKKESRA